MFLFPLCVKLGLLQYPLARSDLQPDPTSPCCSQHKERLPAGFA